MHYTILSIRKSADLKYLNNIYQINILRFISSIENHLKFYLFSFSYKQVKLNWSFVEFENQRYLTKLRYTGGQSCIVLVWLVGPDPPLAPAIQFKYNSKFHQIILKSDCLMQFLTWKWLIFWYQWQQDHGSEPVVYPTLFLGPGELRRSQWFLVAKATLEIEAHALSQSVSHPFQLPISRCMSNKNGEILHCFKSFPSFSRLALKPWKKNLRN